MRALLVIRWVDALRRAGRRKHLKLAAQFLGIAIFCSAFVLLSHGPTPRKSQANPVLEGDIHKDCIVDVLDQQQIGFRWGTRSGHPPYALPFDLAGSPAPDGQIDSLDLQYVYGRHGSTCASPSVPPPAPAIQIASLSIQGNEVRLESEFPGIGIATFDIAVSIDPSLLATLELRAGQLMRVDLGCLEPIQCPLRAGVNCQRVELAGVIIRMRCVTKGPAADAPSGPGSLAVFSSPPGPTARIVGVRIGDGYGRELFSKGSLPDIGQYFTIRLKELSGPADRLDLSFGKSTQSIKVGSVLAFGRDIATNGACQGLSLTDGPSAHLKDVNPPPLIHEEVWSLHFFPANCLESFEDVFIQAFPVDPDNRLVIKNAAVYSSNGTFLDPSDDTFVGDANVITGSPLDATATPVPTATPTPTPSITEFSDFQPADGATINQTVNGFSLISGAGWIRRIQWRGVDAAEANWLQRQFLRVGVHPVVHAVTFRSTSEIDWPNVRIFLNGQDKTEFARKCPFGAGPPWAGRIELEHYWANEDVTVHVVVPTADGTGTKDWMFSVKTDVVSQSAIGLLRQLINRAASFVFGFLESAFNPPPLSSC